MHEPCDLTTAHVRRAVGGDSRSLDWVVERFQPLVLAHIRFLEGEEVRATYDSRALGQPLEASLPAKQALLDSLLATYRQCVDLGVARWAHAATFRIGEALVGFGDALCDSVRSEVGE